jgi:hypothetical protein
MLYGETGVRPTILGVPRVHVEVIKELLHVMTRGGEVALDSATPAIAHIGVTPLCELRVQTALPRGVGWCDVSARHIGVLRASYL